MHTQSLSWKVQSPISPPPSILHLPSSASGEGSIIVSEKKSRIDPTPSPVHQPH